MSDNDRKLAIKNALTRAVGAPRETSAESISNAIEDWSNKKTSATLRFPFVRSTYAM